MSKVDQIRALRENRAKSRVVHHVGEPVDIWPVTNAAEDRLKRRETRERPVESAQAGPTLKTGRPLAKDADRSLSKTKPWLSEGMSRASWYRRQKGDKT
jgi:hypothetical protein